MYDNNAQLQIGLIRSVCRMHVTKLCRFRDFKELAAQRTGIPEERQLWLRWNQITKCHDTAYSPAAVLGRENDDVPMCHFRDIHLASENWTTSLNLMLLVARHPFTNLIVWSGVARQRMVGIFSWPHRQCAQSWCQGSKAISAIRLNFLFRRQPQFYCLEITDQRSHHSKVCSLCSSEVQQCSQSWWGVT